MNLSYNTWKAYKECPKKYFLEYRKKVDPTVVQNDYFKLYGKIAEKFFQMYCNKWRFKTPYLFPEIIRERCEIIFEDILRVSVVDWNCQWAKKTKEDILDDVVRDIVVIMDGPTLNYFLNTKSEVTLTVNTKMGVELVGRLDFLHKDPMDDSKELIIDGKGASKIGRNVDKDQLLFYTLLYFFHHKRFPTGVGFFYYRFNEFKPIKITAPIIDTFRARLSNDIKDLMTRSSFEATPSWKSCKYCVYRENCPDRLEFEASRKKPSQIDLEGDGVIEFGL